MGFLQALGDVTERDVGHLANLGQNIFEYGQLHAPAGSAADVGTSLINAARGSGNDPRTIVDLAQNNYEPTAYHAVLPSSGSPTFSTSGTSNTNINGVNTNTGGTTITGNGSGGLYPAINIPAYNAAVQQKFNTDLTAAQQQYQSAMNEEPNLELQAQNVAGAGIRQAQQNAANQEGIANTNIHNTNAERSLALQQLADQLHGQYQGLMSQLGSVGAGNSSAALMGANALGHQGAISTANANLSADNSNALQNANIQADKSDLATYIASEQAQLNQTLTNIQNQFTSQLQSLAKNIGDSTAEARQSLAYFGGILSHAATLASQQAQQQFYNSITPAMRQQQAQNTAAQNSLQQASGDVAQWIAQNPNLGADMMSTNGAKMQLAPAVTPIAINTPVISPFAPASTGNEAGGQNTPAAFNPQNSQTAQPSSDVVSYLNSLLSSTPGQATSGTNGG